MTQSLEDFLVSKYKGQIGRIDLYERPKSITVSTIVVSPEFRNQGIGAKIMRDIVNHADETNKIVVLTPSSDLGGDIDRLYDFYGRFGFVPNRGANKNFEYKEAMIRYPNINESKPLIKKLLREALESLVHYNDDGTKEIIKGKLIYIRFGLLPKDEKGVYNNSTCYTNNEKDYEECGISVFEALKTKKGIYVFTRGSKMNSSYDELFHSNRKVYIVTGNNTFNEGADGEILLDRFSFKVIAEIKKENLIQSK